MPPLPPSVDKNTGSFVPLKTSTANEAVDAAAGSSDGGSGGGTDSKEGVSWDASDYPYTTDYNDHFESPLQAYLDIHPLLQWLCSEIRKEAGKDAACDNNNKDTYNDDTTQNDVILYDPYYCNGRTRRILRDQLGYPHVVHAKRDFYADIANGTVPAHDIFISNPPYSDTHKIQCLDYCFRQLALHNRPFALLLPAYTATKQYYRDLLSRFQQPQQQHHNQQHGDIAAGTATAVCYLVPHTDYQYDHPDHTGHATSPFASLWFCGLGADRARAWHTHWAKAATATAAQSPQPPPTTKTTTRGTITWAASLAELERRKIIDCHNRPNPRQRRQQNKRRRPQQTPLEQQVQQHPAPQTSSQFSKPQMHHREPNLKDLQTTTPASTATGTTGKTKQKSKFRDADGKRTKARF